jgi:hypothetical protein
MFSFARREKDLVCLAAAALKAQDELAALGLDRRLASPNHLISGRRKHRYELTQSQNALTPTGLLIDMNFRNHKMP